MNPCAFLAKFDKKVSQVTPKVMKLVKVESEQVVCLSSGFEHDSILVPHQRNNMLQHFFFQRLISEHTPC